MIFFTLIAISATGDGGCGCYCVPHHQRDCVYVKEVAVVVIFFRPLPHPQHDLVYVKVVVVVVIFALSLILSTTWCM